MDREGLLWDTDRCVCVCLRSPVDEEVYMFHNLKVIPATEIKESVLLRVKKILIHKRCINKFRIMIKIYLIPVG